MAFWLRSIAVTLGWFLCVGGAAAGLPWLGPAFVFAWLTTDFICTGYRFNTIGFYFSAAIVGYLADSGLTLTGFLSFPDMAQLGSPSPLWMVALWVNLAAGLNGPLRFITRSLFLSVLVGVVGGPLSYAAGVGMGALFFPGGMLQSIPAVAILWAIALPLLVTIQHDWQTGFDLKRRPLAEKPSENQK
jgi:hypothetical protein